MNLATWSIRDPIPAVLLFILLTLAGLGGFRALQVQSFPDLDLPTISVSLRQPGAAPAQLETEVAQRVEDAIATLDGVRHQTTRISDGEVQITVEFSIEHDVSDALSEVKNAVDGMRSQLPADLLEPQVTKVGTVGGRPIATYAVSAPAMDEESLSWFVDDTVGRAVGAVPGVGRFTRVGGVQREVHHLAPDRNRRSRFRNRISGSPCGDLPGVDRIPQFRNGLLYPVPAVSQLSNEFVLSLAEDRDRTLWIGTRSRGLMRLKNDQLTSFAQQGKLDCEDIRALLVSRNGSLWIGSRRTGLGLFENGRLTMFTRADGLAGEEVRMIYEGADGSLWLALQDAGLGRFKDGKFTNYTQADGLPNLRVRAIYEDAEKTLWIGMNQGGLSRFKNGKFFNYSLAQGLFNEAIFFIHQDPQSRFWMSSSRGIFSVSRTNLNEVADGNLKKLFCHSYGVEEGMKELECNGGVQPAGAVTPGGEFWLPTKLGAACLRLEKNPVGAPCPQGAHRTRGGE